jgi:multiple sugar transport system ATP-binding protein
LASLSLDRIEKRYGPLSVVRQVSLDIADGQFVALVGPSGCGKSTLLRMIAGLESISGGDLRIGGALMNNVPPKSRDIAMVFQNYALYPHMTVAENMGFSLRIKGVSKAAIGDRVRNAADIVGLTPYLERMPKELSGGQRQRVAMGRAIVRDPQVFLFDEPLSNLDAKLRVQMRTEIKSLHQRLKTTTVYVTHDQIEAMTMADRIVVMNTGAVEQYGAPLDLYDRPLNLFVAGFIGSPAMNFLPGLVTPAGFVTENGTLLPLPDHLRLPSGTPAVYGVRPEHLDIVSHGGTSAEVLLTEPLGAETQVLMELAGQKVVGVFRERIAASPGDRLSVRPNTAQCHLFDTGTGMRIDR